VRGIVFLKPSDFSGGRWTYRGKSQTEKHLKVKFCEKFKQKTNSKKRKLVAIFFGKNAEIYFRNKQ